MQLHYSLIQKSCLDLQVWIRWTTLYVKTRCIHVLLLTWELQPLRCEVQGLTKSIWFWITGIHESCTTTWPVNSIWVEFQVKKCTGAMRPTVAVVRLLYKINCTTSRANKVEGMQLLYILASYSSIRRGTPGYEATVYPCTVYTCHLANCKIINYATVITGHLNSNVHCRNYYIAPVCIL